MANRKPSDTHKVFKELHKALENLETWVTAAQAELADWLRAHAKEPKAEEGQVSPFPILQLASRRPATSEAIAEPPGRT